MIVCNSPLLLFVFQNKATQDSGCDKVEYVHTFVFDTKIFYNLRTFGFQIMYVSVRWIC